MRVTVLSQCILIVFSLDSKLHTVNTHFTTTTFLLKSKLGFFGWAAPLCKFWTGLLKNVGRSECHEHIYSSLELVVFQYGAGQSGSSGGHETFHRMYKSYTLLHSEFSLDWNHQVCLFWRGRSVQIIRLMGKKTSWMIYTKGILTGRKADCADVKSREENSHDPRLC